MSDRTNNETTERICHKNNTLLAIWKRIYYDTSVKLTSKKNSVKCVKEWAYKLKNFENTGQKSNLSPQKYFFRRTTKQSTENRIESSGNVYLPKITMGGGNRMTKIIHKHKQNTEIGKRIPNKTIQTFKDNKIDKNSCLTRTT